MSFLGAIGIARLALLNILRIAAGLCLQFAFRNEFACVGAGVFSAPVLVVTSVPGGEK